MQSKKPRNKKGLAHGHWEFYHNDGSLWYKGYYINAQQYGYWEWNLINNRQLDIKEYYAK